MGWQKDRSVQEKGAEHRPPQREAGLARGELSASGWEMGTAAGWMPGDLRLMEQANLVWRALQVRSLQQQVGNSVVCRMLKSPARSGISRAQRQDVIARDVVVEDVEAEIELSKGRELGVIGTAPVGHASGWAFMLDPEMILYQQGQYDDQADIPYDAARCGASAILGTAILAGPEGLTAFIERLKAVVDGPGARDSPLLALADQRSMMSDIHRKWHHNPGPGWNEVLSNVVDRHPFTYDDLSRLQAIAYVQYVGRAGGGMSAGEIQAAVSGLAQAQAAPTSPGHYRIPSNARQLGRTIAHNQREVAARFLNPDAPARLQPGQSVILNITMFTRTNHDWQIMGHAVTLSNHNGRFLVYNPETTPVVSFVLPYLPARYRNLPTDNLIGRHLATGESDLTAGEFGLLLGLVSQEITAPFQFQAGGQSQATPGP